jgi:hypothetical protein
MLILDSTQITDLIDLDELIDSLAKAMVDLSEGRTSVPPRSAAQVPDREGALFAMPGFVPSAGMLLIKLVTLFPGNAGTALPTHQAIILRHYPCRRARGTPHVAEPRRARHLGRIQPQGPRGRRRHNRRRAGVRRVPARHARALPVR